MENRVSVGDFQRRIPIVIGISQRQIDMHWWTQWITAAWQPGSEDGVRVTHGRHYLSTFQLNIDPDGSGANQIDVMTIGRQMPYVLVAQHPPYMLV